MKKKRNLSVTKRFNSDDVSNWQLQANEETGGNLTLWIELTLNKSLKNKKK
jgi:hypothetical protein